MSSWPSRLFWPSTCLSKAVCSSPGRGCAISSCCSVSGRLQSSQVAWELLVWSPLQGLTTAVEESRCCWFSAAGSRHGGRGARARLGASAERVPSTPARRRLGVARTTVWIVAGHHGDVVLPPANPRARQVSTAVGDEPSAADSAPALAAYLRSQWSRDRGERAGLHRVVLPGPEANLAHPRWRRIASIREHRQRRNRARAAARPRAPYQPALVLGDAPFRSLRARERSVAIPGLLIQAEPNATIRTPASWRTSSVMSAKSRKLTGDAAFRDGAPGGLVENMVWSGVRRHVARVRGVRFVEVSARGQMVRDGSAANLAHRPRHDLHRRSISDLQRYISQIFPPDSAARCSR